MLVAAARIEQLNQLGVETPARPVAPFEVVPLNPTDADRAADEAYQTACRAWIDAVAALYFEYFPGDTAPPSN